VTSVTGGRALSASGMAGISQAVTQIGRELRSQYVLGYPSGPSREGKWHRVEVSLNMSPAHDHLRIFARKDYCKPPD